MKKYFDSLINTSGAPVVAASISVYNYGTTTLASLFADAAGATTLANPLTSSSAGYFEFYAADGRYTLSISVGGYPVTTISDILLDDPTNASATVVVGGSVDNSPIGASTPSSGRFTTLTSTGDASIGGHVYVTSGKNLAVSGTTAGSIGVTGGTSFSSDGSSIALRGSTASYNGWGMEFYAGGSERMRIDSAGNVLLAGAGNPVRISSGGTSRGSIQISDPYNVTAGAIRTVSFGNNVYLDTAGAWAYSSANVGGSAISMSAENGAHGEIAFFTAQDPDVSATVIERMRIDSSGNVRVTNPAGLGYGTGAGGTVTQATSRTTGVTLNKPTGAITLVSAAGSTSWQSFTVTNSLVAATDLVKVSQKSGTDKYMTHVTNVAAGSFQITFATTGGTTTEQPVFSFALIKGATS